MEMHQIRYFLATARTLNFTRAAEECNVAQPSLTRAIQQLEAELGGDLFVRERSLTHLSELGARMLPLVQQCYDSANSAKSLASSLKSGAITPLKLALSLSINIALVLPQLTSLSRSFKGLELKFLRGSCAEVIAALQKGAADLAIAGPWPGDWDRLDHWPLFTETFDLAVNESHRLANSAMIDAADLQDEEIIRRSHCESAEKLDGILNEFGIGQNRRHEASSEADVAALLNANVGVAVVPRSASLPPPLRRLRIKDINHTRTVSVYAVAGRQRPPAVSALLKMLRATDWSNYASDGD
jgi:DNA-binding transcriptional LysR family regulator